jgi:hypothetical protein
MKPKIACLVAAITTVTVIMASSLSGASQQVWRPEVARAAKVTINLFKGNAIAPVRFIRNTQNSTPPEHPSSSPQCDTQQDAIPCD